MATRSIHAARFRIRELTRHCLNPRRKIAGASGPAYFSASKRQTRSGGICPPYRLRVNEKNQHALFFDLFLKFKIRLKRDWKSHIQIIFGPYFCNLVKHGWPGGELSAPRALRSRLQWPFRSSQQILAVLAQNPPVEADRLDL